MRAKIAIAPNLSNIMKLNIIFSTFEVEAEIFDTPTGRAIYDAAPFKQHVNTWGEEIYFGVSVHSDLEEGARADVNRDLLQQISDGEPVMMERLD